MAEKTQIASKQTTFSLDKNTFSIPGYVFLGWSTIPGDTVAQYTDGQAVQFDDDTTLYAVWRPAQQVTITFDGNGAMDEHQEPYSETKLVYESSEIGELPTPTRVGYQFYGWWSDRTGGYPVTETTIVNASATYYARWASGSSGKGGATPHPCFTYDDNRFITGVHQVSPPNDYGTYSTAVITQKHIYDDYALGIITLGGIADRTKLKVLECPNVEYISQDAFTYVPLVRAIFPNLRQGVANLFYNKSTLTYVDLGKIEEIPIGMFYQCSNLNNVTIPNTTTKIGNQVFYGCTSLESIVIPDSVTSIGSTAFSGCSSLTSVIFEGDEPTLGTNAFANVASGCKAYVDGTLPGWSQHPDGSNWNGLIVEYRDAQTP